MISVLTPYRNSSTYFPQIMANKMSTLFKQWDVIAMVLEDVFLKQMTDWCELAQVSQRKYPRSLIKHIKPPREIVFSLNHFTKPVLICKKFFFLIFLYINVSIYMYIYASEKSIFFIWQHSTLPAANIDCISHNSVTFQL